jgi:hypothetical protein
MVVKRKNVTGILLCIIILLIINIQMTTENKNLLRLKRGTAIAAFVKKDTVWIAADTKVTTTNERGQILEVKKVRKIHQTDGVYYAFVELPEVIYDGKTIFSAITTLDDIIWKVKDRNKVVAQFVDTTLKQLDELISIYKQIAADQLLEMYTRKSILGFIVVWFDNGEARFEQRTFRFEKTLTGFKTVLEPARTKFPENNLLLLGSYENAAKFLQENKKYFVGFKDMKERIICLVKEEADKNSEWVGLPIDAVEIDKGGPKWYLDNTECKIKE